MFFSSVFFLKGYFKLSSFVIEWHVSNEITRLLIYQPQFYSDMIYQRLNCGITILWKYTLYVGDIYYQKKLYFSRRKNVTSNNFKESVKCCLINFVIASYLLQLLSFIAFFHLIVSQSA